MIDPSTIGTALATLKATKDIAEAMIKLGKGRTLEGKHAELLSKIVDTHEAVWRIQQERATLLERIGELEEQVAQLEAWGAEQQKYELRQVATGAFVYAPKKTVQGDETPHWLCTNCYQRGKKRFLQKGPMGRTASDRSESAYGCAECRTTIYVHFPITPKHVAD